MKPEDDNHVDPLIKGNNVLDVRQEEFIDVITGDSIADAGKPKTQAERALDGRIIFPGFIDAHTQNICIRSI
jgi:adenine deaminase